MKQKLAFALIMGLITTGIISFTLISVNVGYTGLFFRTWFRSWAMAYLVAIPAILLIAPRIQAFVDRAFKPKEKHDKA